MLGPIKVVAFLFNPFSFCKLKSTRVWNEIIRNFLKLNSVKVFVGGGSSPRIQFCVKKKEGAKVNIVNILSSSSGLCTLQIGYLWRPTMISYLTWKYFLQKCQTVSPRKTEYYFQWRTYSITNNISRAKAQLITPNVQTFITLLEPDTSASDILVWKYNSFLRPILQLRERPSSQ